MLSLVHVDGGDYLARQSLAQYIARAPLSLQKLTYDRSGGKVLHHSSYNPYFKQNTSLWSAPDFIAHLTPQPWMARADHVHTPLGVAPVPWGAGLGEADREGV